MMSDNSDKSVDDQDSSKQGLTRRPSVRDLRKRFQSESTTNAGAAKVPLRTPKRSGNVRPKSVSIPYYLRSDRENPPPENKSTRGQGCSNRNSVFAGQGEELNNPLSKQTAQVQPESSPRPHVDPEQTHATEPNAFEADKNHDRDGEADTNLQPAKSSQRNTHKEDNVHSAANSAPQNKADTDTSRVNKPPGPVPHKRQLSQSRSNQNLHVPEAVESKPLSNHSTAAYDNSASVMVTLKPDTKEQQPINSASVVNNNSVPTNSAADSTSDSTVRRQLPPIPDPIMELPEFQLPQESPLPIRQSNNKPPTPSKSQPWNYHANTLPRSRKSEPSFSHRESDDIKLNPLEDQTTNSSHPSGRGLARKNRSEDAPTQKFLPVSIGRPPQITPRTKRKSMQWDSETVPTSLYPSAEGGDLKLKARRRTNSSIGIETSIESSPRPVSATNRNFKHEREKSPTRPPVVPMRKSRSSAYKFPPQLSSQLGDNQTVTGTQPSSDTLSSSNSGAQCHGNTEPQALRAAAPSVVETSDQLLNQNVSMVAALRQDVKETIANLTQRFEQAANEIADRSKQQNQFVVPLQQEIQQHQQSQATMKKEIQQLRIQQKESDMKLHQLNFEKKEVDRQMRALQESFEVTQGKREQLEKQVTELQPLVETLQKENEDLSELVIKLTSTRDHLKQDVIAKEAEIQQLKINQSDELAPYRLHFQDPLQANRQVGSGCYGTVYAVEIDGVQCIAKRVQDILLGERGQAAVGEDERRAIKKKFRRECILLSKIRHPNIVQFMGVQYGQDMYDLTLVMERLPIDLQKFLERCQADKFSIPLSIRFSILVDVTYGLLHLHNRSILHRDLTAGNILLTSNLRAKIADLGVSRIVRPRHSQDLTTIPGTHAYMPPEALQDEPEYNDKLDIFSFGVLALFVALQEFPVFSYDNVPDTVVAKRQAELYKRRKWMSKIGERHSLYEVIRRCLHDVSTGRPSTQLLNKMMKELSGKFPRRQQDLTKMLTQLKKLGMISL